MASHGGTGLGGNANRLPPLARHEHRFHRGRPLQAARFFFSALLCVLCALCELCVEIFVFFHGSQAKQIPHRSIRRRKPLLHLGKRNPRFFSEPLPQRRGKIRNLRYIKFSLRIQAMINLRPAKRRLTKRHAELAQLFLRFSEEFHFAVVAANLHAVSLSSSHYRLPIFRRATTLAISSSRTKSSSA